LFVVAEHRDARDALRRRFGRRDHRTGIISFW
jgi:hypothetical protein